LDGISQLYALLISSISLRDETLGKIAAGGNE
jgi:hypothetical protein